MQRLLKGKLAFKACVLFATVCLGVLAVHFLGLASFTPEFLVSQIQAWGPLGVFFYILLLTVRPLVFFPAVVFTLAGGMAYGPWWGSIYAIIGGFLGTCFSFMLARLLGRSRLERQGVSCRYLTYLDEHAGMYGFQAILLMRLVPLFHYDLVSYAAGLSKMRFKDYALATLLGMMPGTFAFNMLGYSLTQVFSPLFFAALALVLAVMVTPLMVHRAKKAK